MNAVLARAKPIISAVAEGVALPIGVYLVMTALGARDTVALTATD